jgi:hypothetical protein
LIVVSILVAFGIDTWWDGRQDRDREASAIAGIEEDFRGNLAALHRQIGRHEVRIESARLLLSAVGPSAPSGDSTVIEAIGVIGIADPVRFQDGTLRTLINTSGLSILRDPDLRIALTEWSQGVEDLEVVNDFLMQEARRLNDYLGQRYSLQDLDRAAGAVDLPPSPFSADTSRLLRDLAFANIVYQQYYASTVMKARLATMVEIAERVLAAAARG